MPPVELALEPGLQAALTKLNQLRAEAGVAPLKLQAQLTKAAQDHATDMAIRGYFSHYSPGGAGPGQRITAAGYSWSTYGENIAMGYRDWSAAIDGWMTSAGHRRNLLNATFTELGLGVADRRYVQVFARPRR